MNDLSRRILVSHRDVIRASPKLVWSMVLEKIRTPEKYVPGVSKVTILREGGPHFIERKATVGSTTMHQIISADDHVMSVIYRTHSSHPTFTGYVSNTVLPDPASEKDFAWGEGDGPEATTCVLDVTMNLSAKPTVSDESVAEARANVGDAVAEAFAL
jgi:hypothetical protein